MAQNYENYLEHLKDASAFCDDCRYCFEYQWEYWDRTQVTEYKCIRFPEHKQIDSPRSHHCAEFDYA